MRELDLSAIRARLASQSATACGTAKPQSGPTYWRSLDELAQTEEFTALVHREFPEHAAEWNDPAGRRQFLKLMGASIALAGATACTRQPAESIVPYVRQPEELIPGKPLSYATAMPHGGYATPVLATSHEGRPTKIEPNPEHPSFHGGTDVFAQAAILTLYDPDRSKALKYRNDDIRPFAEFASTMQGAVNGQKALQGAGFRLLTETITSPTLAWQIEQLLAPMPAATWIQFDPITRDHARAGARTAFGQDVEVRYRFDKADVVLLLDADVFEHGPGRLRYARDFADTRRLVGGHAGMNRLYAIESRTSNSGSKADHRLAVRASDVEPIARAIGAALGVGSFSGELPKAATEKWIGALVRDLQAHRGTGLVVAGEHQPPAVHHLAHAINASLGNAGQTVEYTAPVEARPMDQLGALRELAQEMDEGKVDVLVILSANPVFTAPADLKFAERMNKVPLRVHLGLYEDETSQLCHWHIPETHFLEAWSDVRAFDGTVSLCQPLIAPLYDNNKSTHEVIAAFTASPVTKGLDIIRGFWEQQFTQKSGAFGPLTDAKGQAFGDFTKFWRQALHDGFIAGSVLPALPTPSASAVPAASAAAPRADALEVTFSADATIYDGRFANNGWLQETPKPFSKVTWDNAALVGPALAARLGLRTNDVIDVKLNGRAITAAVWVTPGHPDQSINLQFGYGRTHAGQVGNNSGYNPYVLRTTDRPWFATGVEVAKTGATYQLASTQMHFNLEGRAIVRVGTKAEYEADPHFAHAKAHSPSYDMTLHNNEWKYDNVHAWGMAIDLNACDGCNACVVACTAENNIPVIGREQIRIGREMQWIRIDRYYEGSAENPTVHDQPMLCQQCENAPCEVVCPVAATVHSKEGLNDMVYNRCVGTRYCSNNCPYKVRRFNFLLYSDWTTPTLKMGRNPNVTVRSRGVMEKCTYCVQRINAARIQSRLEERPIRDGEITTACEAACPTQAIAFGDINDTNSRVRKWKDEPRNYGVLEELNTRPRTTYLASVRNPNPELEPPAAGAGAGSHGAGRVETPASGTH